MNFAGTKMKSAGATDSVAGAVMTQHFAQKSSDEAANAVMSAHLAAKCISLNEKIYYRYL